MRKGTRTLTKMEQFLDTRNHFRGVALTRSGIALPLRPTSESATYEIRIDYAPTTSPKVFVLSPALVGNAPHVYKRGYLCLYWHEYENSMGFGDTIVPWTAEWLYFYELWQVTGEWLAPESPHRGPK